MKTIQIAPCADEITRVGNVFSCDFNKMHIEWNIEADCNDMNEDNERKLKDWLSMAIAMSGKLWQVPYLLNANLPFPSKIYVNGNEIDYPKN